MPALCQFFYFLAKSQGDTIAISPLAKMPNPQTNLRLSPAIREMAIAAARERKMGLSQFIEQAITCYLKAENEADSRADSRADNGADTRTESKLLSRLAALESRVAALEWHTQAAYPESPTRDMNVH